MTPVISDKFAEQVEAEIARLEPIEAELNAKKVAAIEDSTPAYIAASEEWVRVYRVLQKLKDLI